MDCRTGLETINAMRAKVYADRQLTGENLFIVWGYTTVVFFLLEFAALLLWNRAPWTYFVWMGIPVVGTPLMVHFLRKDLNRTHRISLNSNIILQMWIFIGGACFVGGWVFGFTGLFERCFCWLVGLLCSMGCFMTGVILRFSPKTICGIIAAILSWAPLFVTHEEEWIWQLPMTALSIIVSLIIPGHLFRQYVKKYE